MLMSMSSRDEGDSMNRSEERLKWRQERWNKRPRNDPEERNPYGLEDMDNMVRHVSLKDDH